MTSQKRSPVVAVVLSIFMPGLGQMYNGQLQKGVIYILIGYLPIIFLIFTHSHLLSNFSGMMVFLLIGILWWIFIISDALYIAIKRKEIIQKFYNKFGFYVLFSALSILSIIMQYGIEKQFIGQLYHVTTRSMEPSLLSGDYVYIDKMYDETTRPQRNDVIAFKYPKNPSLYLVGRIIATEADSIEIMERKIFLNSLTYNDSYGHYMTERTDGLLDNMKLIKIQNGSVFVMGDNRDASLDSRVWGPINTNDIVGKMFYVVWRKNSRD